MAVATASGRWVKVAQPRPYSPGSLVITLTTTRRMPSGAVRMTWTSRMRGMGEPVLDMGMLLIEMMRRGP